jgi:HPt (histidine-containing phosphotransfer) domain-containing protein
MSIMGIQGNTAMIDWKRVEELQREIGADGFAEVAQMFLDEADQAARALAADPAPDEVEAQLHFLKGSALNLGLSDLAAICQDGERKAAAGYGALVDLAQVTRVYQASRAHLLIGLQTQPVARVTAA